MKLFVLGHEDIVLGFSLIGVEGLATDDPTVALQRLEDVVARGDTGLILITAQLAGLLSERLREMESAGVVPIVLQLPAPGEPLERPPVRDLVRQALGVKL